MHHSVSVRINPTRDTVLMHHVMAAASPSLWFAYPRCLQTSWIVMCSSASAAISHEMQQHFGVSPTISRLPVAMFLFGLALGPVVLMPLAEVSKTIIDGPRRGSIFAFRITDARRSWRPALLYSARCVPLHDLLCHPTKGVFTDVCQIPCALAGNFAIIAVFR